MHERVQVQRVQKVQRVQRERYRLFDSAFGAEGSEV
jgi:hypothetical protein